MSTLSENYENFVKNIKRIGFVFNESLFKYIYNEYSILLIYSTYWFCVNDKLIITDNVNNMGKIIKEIRSSKLNKILK